MNWIDITLQFTETLAEAAGDKCWFYDDSAAFKSSFIHLFAQNDKYK